MARHEALKQAAQIGQYGMFSPCPDCLTIVSWHDTHCKCGCQICRDCPSCKTKYWTCWIKCKGCKNQLPKVQYKGISTPNKPFPQLPQEHYSPVGPCPECWEPAQREDYGKCRDCRHLLRKDCKSKCGGKIYPWWHKCNFCGWPNQWSYKE